MTLRRSFDNLKRLGGRITGELIPQMVKDAQRLEAVDLDTLVDSALAEELKSRESVYNKWKGVYWDEFIPFAHGARLFGQVYNDRMGPDDPHEFIEIISAEEAVSVKRNRAIEALAKKVLDQPGIIGEDLLVKDDKLKKDMLELLKNFPGLAAAETDDEAKLKVLSSIIRKTAFSSRNGISTDKRDPKQLENKFIESFNGDEKKGAIELLELGKLSYRLRDDDNVYLGRIESELMRAMSISTKRLGKRCEDNRTCQAAEEVIMALKMPDYQPKQQINEDAGTETRPASSLRQMRGQPAGKGIARGKARVVRSRADLFKVQDGEIIVCDSVDPEMTFIIPVVAGLVERRGGMLIHGAIIAREYGIPCVTGVEDAPVRIKTGSEITVDGYFGLVIDHSVSEKV